MAAIAGRRYTPVYFAFMGPNFHTTTPFCDNEQARSHRGIGAVGPPPPALKSHFPPTVRALTS